MIESTYDVIVVGSGTGGAAASKFLSQRGLKTLMVDKSKRKDIHKICGDATSNIHFERVTERDPDKKNIINPPSSENGEIHQILNGFSFFTPDKDLTRYDIPTDGASWIIAREKFTARLINEAEDAGVNYFDQTTVRTPIVENDIVVGVNLRTKDKELMDVKAKLIIDASGMAGIIRRHLNEEKTYMDKVIHLHDLAAAHRELIEFNDYSFEKPDHIEMYFDMINSPGGYFWIFPRGEKSANVGLGIEPRRYPGGPRASYNWWTNHLKHIFKDYKVTHSGGWNVPLRRPMDSLVWNGVVLIGDAGSCVKATDGGGIGLSMISASQSINPIMNAFEKDDFSVNGPLWNYNIRFMRETGAHEAPLALAKSEIVKASNKVLNTLLQKEVISPQDLYNLNAGRPFSTNLSSNIKRAYRGRNILGFLIKITKTMSKMSKVKEMYFEYPDNYNDLTAWSQDVANIFDDKKRADLYYKETDKSSRSTK